MLTKAYRSVSTSALPVLAGVLPADLEVTRVGRVEEECPEDATGRERRALKRTVMREVVSRWQDRWTSSEKGRELWQFLPDVEQRLSYGWIEPDYEVSQILTGHGNFNSRLHEMTLRDSPICPCEEAAETRDHILWECKLYAEERDQMLDGWSRSWEGPVYHQELVNSREGFLRLRAFAHRWHGKRKELS